MNNLFTISNITFAIGILAIIFSVFRYFRDPQIQSDKTDTILALEIKQLKEEIQNLKNNHIHSLEVAIANTNLNLNALTIQVAKLATIIDERNPRKL